MHDSAQGGPQRAWAGGEKRVTPLELFFDLVFVFALTQVTYFLLDPAGFEPAANIVVVGYILWSIWLASFGIFLLRRGREGRRTSP